MSLTSGINHERRSELPNLFFVCDSKIGSCNLTATAPTIPSLISGPSKFELKNTERPELIKELIEQLEKIDESFLKHVEREDMDITYMTSKGERTSKVSMITSTMINHATEHRTQIVAALDKNNIRTINLDNYSPWSLPG